jgi:hypothetical protein
LHICETNSSQETVFMFMDVDGAAIGGIFCMRVGSIISTHTCRTQIIVIVANKRGKQSNGLKQKASVCCQHAISINKKCQMVCRTLVRNLIQPTKYFFKIKFAEVLINRPKFAILNLLCKARNF